MTIYDEPGQRGAANLQTSNRDKALALARGDFQRHLVLGQETLGGSSLRGKAKDYRGSYERSARSLLRRLDEAGIVYVIERGPRGGWHSATLTFPA